MQIMIGSTARSKIVTFLYFSSSDLACQSIYPTCQLRWSSIELNRCTLTVCGYLPRDCIEALHQEKDSHPDGERDSDRKMTTIHIKLGYNNDLWKDTPKHPFLRSEIKELYQVIQTEYTSVRTITFGLYTGSGMSSWLRSIELLEYLLSLQEPIPNIHITDSTISVEDLRRWWRESGCRYQKRINFSGVDLLLPPKSEGEHRKQLVQWVGEVLGEELANEMTMGAGVVYSFNNPNICLGNNVTFEIQSWPPF